MIEEEALAILTARSTQSPLARARRSNPLPLYQRGHVDLSN